MKQRQTYLGIFLWLLSFATFAATKTSGGSGNWSTITWSPSAPVAGDDVIIATTHTVTVNGAYGSFNSLTVNGTLNWTVVNTVTVNGGGNVDLAVGSNLTGTVAGIITTSGSLIVNTTATSTTAGITMTGASKTITGNGSIGRLTVSGTTSNNGTLTVTTTLAGASTLTNTGTLNIGAASVTPTLTATAVGNIVNYNRANTQTIKGTTYHHLTISGSNVKTLGGNTALNGNLTVSAGTLSLSTFNFTVNGTTSVAGILTDGSNTGSDLFVGAVTTTAAGRCTTTTVTTAARLEFRGGISHANATANTFLAAAATFTTNAQILSGAGTINFSGAVISNIVLTNNGIVTMTSTAAAALSGAGSWTQGSGSSFNYAGSTITIAAYTFSTSTNTVTYTSALAQTAYGVTYHHLSFSGAGTKTLNNNATINGNVNISAGTFDLGTTATTLNVTGTATVTGTLTFNGTTTKTVSITGNLSGAGTINMSGGSLLHALNLGGATNALTTLTTAAVASTITYNRAGAQSVFGSANYRNLTISGSGIKTLGGNSTINNNLTVSAGTIEFSTRTVTVTGTSNITGAFSDGSNTGTNTFVGAVTLNPGATWTSTSVTTAGRLVFRNGITNDGSSYNAGIATFNTNAQALGGSTTYSFTGAVAVTGVTLTNNGTVTMSSTAAGAINGTGGWTQGANSSLNYAGSTLTVTTRTFNGSPNTITFNRGGNQTIPSATYHHLVVAGTSGTKSLGGNIIVNGDLTFSQILDASATNYTIDLKGDWINNNSFTPRSGTVTFSGTAAGQTIGGTTTTNTFYNLTISNTHASGVSLNADQNLSNILTLGANSTFITTGYVFTLLSTATASAAIAVVPASATLTGNVTLQRFATGGTTGWACMGTALNGTTLADWGDDFPTAGFTGSSGNANGVVSVYTYDETVNGVVDNGYTAATNITNTVSPGQGFFVFLGDGASTTNDLTIDVINTPVIGDVPLPVTYTNTGSVNDDGWNLISNPYPSPISWSSALAAATTPANVEDAVYVWNADLNSGTGGYAQYVGGVSSPAVGAGGVDNTIPTNQAFFVHLTGATTWTVTESVKTTGNPTYLKQNHNKIDDPIPNIFRLFVKGNDKYLDETVIRLHKHASEQFDKSYDAYKMYNGVPESPMICTKLNGVEYSINSIDEFKGNVTIPVRVKVGSSGNYTIFTDSLNHFNTTSCVMLEDLVTGQVVDLKNTYFYTCYISDTTNAPRFLIKISNSVAVSYKDASCFNSNDGKIIIKSGEGVVWDYELTQVGKNDKVIKNNLTGADSLINLEPGMYVIIISGATLCATLNDTVVISSPKPTKANFVADVDTVVLSENNMVSFTNLSTDAIDYSWDFGDTTTTYNDKDPNYYYDHAGSYVVTLIANGSCVSDTVYKTVVVVDSLTTLVGVDKTIITPGSGMDAFYSKGELSVLCSFAQPASLDIHIMNIEGAQVHRETINGITSGAHQIALPPMASGIYVVNIIINNNGVFRKKIILP